MKWGYMYLQKERQYYTENIKRSKIPINEYKLTGNDIKKLIKDYKREGTREFL